MEKLTQIFLLLFTITALIPSTLPISNSFANYHQQLVYPSPKNLFQGSVSLGHYPVQTPTGLSLKSPSLSSLLKFGFFDLPKIKGPPVYPLFTPNTFDQRPATVGQIEEYKKALAEEALEKKQQEQQENEVSSSLGAFSGFDHFDVTTKPTHYVDVRGDTFNYKYRI